MVKVTSFTSSYSKSPKKKTFQKLKLSNHVSGSFSKPSQIKQNVKSINPFDKFANARKKHDVLNRRIKGEDRDVGRAKRKAVDDRKNRLLSQYQKVKKSNMFVDKRFGESDADLSLEDKMFLRFQKEKIRTSKNTTIYNLDSVPEVSLTHKGQILGVSNINDRDFSEDDNDDDNNNKFMEKEIVNKLHFGGGLVEKSSTGSGNDTTDEISRDNMRPSHYDTLQEIISKSKIQKKMKKDARDELDMERERLDQAFKELLSESVIEYRPTKEQYEREDDVDVDGNDENIDEYDKSLRTMAFETKVKATDRTKTAEEIAIEAKEKLDGLEEARLARMKKSSIENSEEENGNNFSTKKRHCTDDEIDFDVINRKKKKEGYGYGNEIDVDVDGEEEEGEDSNEDGDDEEEEEDDYEIDDYDNPGTIQTNNPGIDENSDEIDSDDKSDEDDDDDDAEEFDEEKLLPEDVIQSKHNLRSIRTNESYNPNKSDTMPHRITCPSDIQEFYDLINQYTSNLKDIEIFIDRILIWNSPLLPGSEGMNNKVSMHNFLDILFKYFIRVGDTLSSVSLLYGIHMNDKSDLVVNHTTSHSNDVLSHIFKLCQDISEVISTLCGRWIKLLESQFQKRLRDYSMGISSISCFPSLGQILLFQLFGHIFSVSDYHHAIVTSSILFLSQLLVQCPISTIDDISSGLLITSILIDLMESSGTIKYVPEILSFVTSIIAFYCCPSSIHESPSSLISSPLKSFSKNLSILRNVFHQPSIDEKSNLSENIMKMSWSWFDSVKNKIVIDQNISCSVLSTIYNQIDRLITYYSKDVSTIVPTATTTATTTTATKTNQERVVDSIGIVDSIPEIFEDLILTMKFLNPHQKPCVLPISMQKIHADILTRMISCYELCKKQRIPLQWRKQVVTAMENKNPRFDINYKMRKDVDEDKEKNLLKQLKRQYKREKKAATRELRRDSEYLDQVRYAEKQEQRLEQQQERWKNYSWLEQQQAILNTHVKKFRGELKGGGSNGVKPIKSRRVVRGKNK